jgi:uridine kinase
MNDWYEYGNIIRGMKSVDNISHDGPFVIGIFGPSGSGKSSLAQTLSNQWGESAVLFHEDPKFFKRPASTSYEHRDPSSEEPDYVDWDAYTHALLEVIHQQEQNCETVVVIVEHFLLLHDVRVVNQLNGLIFLDPGSDTDAAMWTFLERRVTRNPHRSPKEVFYLCKYYQTAVWPSYLKNSHDSATMFCAKHQGEQGQVLVVDTSTMDAAPRKRALKVNCVQQSAADIAEQVERVVSQWQREVRIEKV